METLMFDPISKDLYVLEKDHDVALASIYKFTPPMEANVDPIVMEFLGQGLLNVL